MVSQEAHEHSSTTCNGNVLFAENKIYECIMKIRGLSMEDLCVEKSSTPPVWIFFLEQLIWSSIYIKFHFCGIFLSWSYCYAAVPWFGVNFLLYILFPKTYLPKIPHINSETNPPPTIINLVCKYLRQFLGTSVRVATLLIYCNTK